MIRERIGIISLVLFFLSSCGNKESKDNPEMDEAKKITNEIIETINELDEASEDLKSWENALYRDTSDYDGILLTEEEDSMAKVLRDSVERMKAIIEIDE